MAEHLIPAHARQATTTMDTDVLILDAWERRRVAWDRYETGPDVSTRESRATEAECVAIADAAEEFIRLATATTARGLEIQLWASLSHNADASQRKVSTLVEREDLAGLLAIEDEFDWSTRLMLGALRSARAMGAQ